MRVWSVYRVGGYFGVLVRNNEGGGLLFEVVRNRKFVLEFNDRFGRE